MHISEVLNRLRQISNPDNLSGMSKFGIDVKTALGIRIPQLRSLAKELKYNHKLALDLWETQIHESRILASLIENPKEVELNQMNSWTEDFNSWDLCDQCCNNLYRKTSHKYEVIIPWCTSKMEFVKRAGFVMIAVLAVHDKKAEDQVFIEYIDLIENNAADDRNFVKKGVNWALRQIGKRNAYLNGLAIESAKSILDQNSQSANWIAIDALQELQSEKIQLKLKAT